MRYSFYRHAELRGENNACNMTAAGRRSGVHWAQEAEESCPDGKMISSMTPLTKSSSRLASRLNSNTGKSIANLSHS